MLLTRHAIEAVLMTRRPAPCSEPNLRALALGLAAFVLVAATCLYLAAALGG